MKKVYVDVNADHHSIDGIVVPKIITWEDGQQYEVDRIVDIRRAASLKAGGIGTRYTILILGKQTYIWLEDDGIRWFVEAKY
jgi:hypothetical protein